MLAGKCSNCVAPEVSLSFYIKHVNEVTQEILRSRSTVLQRHGRKKKKWETNKDKTQRNNCNEHHRNKMNCNVVKSLEGSGTTRGWSGAKSNLTRP